MKLPVTPYGEARRLSLTAQELALLEERRIQAQLEATRPPPRPETPADTDALPPR